ncbi:MAG: chromosomal replication initiator protein DnaA [Chloroflexota bacterium]|nr:chromosomal replication initiator protein DnaA [Chloroflexota bacterium]
MLANEIWEAALGELQLQLTRANYETWLKDTTGLRLEDNQFTIGVPSPFAAEWLEQRLNSLVRKTLIGITGKDLEVLFQVNHTEHHPATTRSRPRRKGNSSSPAGSTDARRTPLYAFNPKYTFDSFIVGNCNRLAHAAALAVAENPGQVYNPLFIYGGVGLGKTHLLHAVGHMVGKGDLNALYVSTEQFTNEFIKSIRERKTEEFRNKYRGVDVLLIDDIHFIMGKEQTQEGFFHTFNDLHNANRQIIITSDRPPKSMPLLEDRLRSRFGWGLIADIHTPTLETRHAILQAKAEELNLTVPQDVIDLIAHKSQRSIRELEGALNRVVAFAKLTKSDISQELTARALAEFPDTAPRHSLSVEFIVATVADYFHLSHDALTGKGRDSKTARARHVAVYLAREETDRSFADIGRGLGGRDHSSVLRGYERIANEINNDAHLRRDILEIRDQLYSKNADPVPAHR